MPYDSEVVSRYRYHPHMIYSIEQKDPSHMQSRLPEHLRQLKISGPVKAGFINSLANHQIGAYFIEGRNVTLWLHDEEGKVKSIQPLEEFEQGVTHV